MWQEIWNEDVSIIYKDILRESRRVYLCLTPVIGLILSGNVSRETYAIRYVNTPHTLQ